MGVNFNLPDGCMSDERFTQKTPYKHLCTVRETYCTTFDFLRVKTTTEMKKRNISNVSTKYYSNYAKFLIKNAAEPPEGY